MFLWVPEGHPPAPVQTLIPRTALWRLIGTKAWKPEREIEPRQPGCSVSRSQTPRSLNLKGCALQTRENLSINSLKTKAKSARETVPECQSAGHPQEWGCGKRGGFPGWCLGCTKACATWLRGPTSATHTEAALKPTPPSWLQQIKHLHHREALGTTDTLVFIPVLQASHQKLSSWQDGGTSSPPRHV